MKKAEEDSLKAIASIGETTQSEEVRRLSAKCLEDLKAANSGPASHLSP